MNINICKNLILAIIVLLHCACANANEAPDAKLTLKIVSEGGHPLENVSVGATFETPNRITQNIEYNTVKRVTDKNGVCVVTGKTMFNVGYGATKAGYYNSLGEYRVTSNENGRWLPWNPEIIVVLRKIDNPVPMYSRNTHVSPLKVPILQKTVGFDLIEFDWVAPFGKGKQSDFVFRLASKYNSEVDYDAKLELTFVNKFDGIQLVKENRKYGSELKLPRTAPTTGYENKLIRSLSRRPNETGKGNQGEDNNYIFRIRSEEKNGKLVRAMYGKIHGDIFIHPPMSIYFKFYLNPDYSRNLEFNPQRNLFIDIPRGERIGLD
jgi:hypothetical protein